MIGYFWEMCVNPWHSSREYEFFTSSEGETVGRVLDWLGRALLGQDISSGVIQHRRSQSLRMWDCRRPLDGNRDLSFL